MLETAGVELMREPLTCSYKPTAEVLAECRQVGAALAAKAKELAG